MGTEEKRDFNAMVGKVKEEVRNGVSEKTMTITDISVKMTAAFNEIKEEYLKDIEEAIKESQHSKDENCKQCEEPLKKTEN